MKSSTLEAVGLILLSNTFNLACLTNNIFKPFCILGKAVFEFLFY